MKCSVEVIKNRLESLRSERGELNDRMEELTGLLYPYKRYGASQMWDTTASEACIKLSSLLSSLITPPGQKWHGLAEPLFSHQTALQGGNAEAKRVRQWCDEVTDTLFSFRERSGSGFVGCFQSFYASVVEFGTGCFYVEADVDERGVSEGIRYISVPLSDVYFSVNHQNEVDSVYREFQFTAEQIARKWGEEVLSSRMRSSLGRKEADKFQIIHAVYPKGVNERKSDAARGKNLHSQFVCVDENRFLHFI